MRKKWDATIGFSANVNVIYCSSFTMKKDVIFDFERCFENNWLKKKRKSSFELIRSKTKIVSTKLNEIEFWIVKCNEIVFRKEIIISDENSWLRCWRKMYKQSIDRLIEKQRMKSAADADVDWLIWWKILLTKAADIMLDVNYESLQLMLLLFVSYNCWNSKRMKNQEKLKISC